MKEGIHPTWYPDAVVTCACGNTWTTGSTKKEIHTDVCSKCHPFFTGEQRIVDTAGQVERFMKRISAKEQKAATQPAAEDKRAKRERRRERKAGVTAEAPTPTPPAELPLAVASTPDVEPDTTTEPGVVEVAPIVEIEELKPEENAIVAPAAEIGEVASIDKIIEPTGPVGEETTPPAAEEVAPPAAEAPSEAPAAEAPSAQAPSAQAPSAEAQPARPIERAEGQAGQPVARTPRVRRAKAPTKGAAKKLGEGTPAEKKPRRRTTKPKASASGENAPQAGTPKTPTQGE